MATRDIADQLRDFQLAQEAARRTVDEIQHERDLLKEVSKLAKNIKLEFNETTKNIGKSVTELRFGEELSQKLQNSVRDRNAIENNLIELLKNQSKLQNDLNDLDRIKSLSALDRFKEYNNHVVSLGKELKLGKMTREEYQSQTQLLLKRYYNTDDLYLKQLEILSINISQSNLAKDALDLENENLDKLKKKVEFNTRLSSLGSKISQDFGKLGTYFTEAITPTKVLFDIIETGYENFKLFDKAAVNVRQKLGLLPGDAKTFEQNIKSLGIEMMHLGASFEDIANSIISINSELTGFVSTDKELLRTTTALSKQFGISESTSAKFFKTLGGVAGESANSQRSITGFAQQLAKSADIPLGQLMEDVANASDDVRLFTGQSAISLVKAAAQARMMGTDLNKAASSAQKLLQFESSISSELKASALLGQNINFNYARQLSFNKDIIGANKEIFKIAKQVKFNQLNPIQQQAFAEAAGKSVSELQDMFQQEKNIALVKQGSNEQAKKALAEYETLMKMKDEEAKDAGKLAEQDIIRKANQEKLLQLQNKFNQLLSELAAPVMKLTEVLLDIAISIMPLIISSVKSMSAIIGGVAIVNGLKSIRVTFSFIKNVVPTFMSGFKSASTFFGGISAGTKNVTKLFRRLSSLLKIFGVFGRFLGPIGLIISAFSLIGNLMKRWKEAPEGFLGKLKAIGLALVDTFIGPFIDIADWISGLFGGPKMSKLFTSMGLLIVNGLKSVGGLIINVITWPYRTAWNIISKLFTSMGPSIVNGLKSVGGLIISVITWPYRNAWNIISKLFTSMGPSIVNGLKSVGEVIISVITWPYRTAWNIISKLFTSIVPLIVPLIVNGLKSVGELIINVITWPFRNAWNIISKLFKSTGSLIVNPFKNAFDWVMNLFGGKSPSKLGLSILKGITSISGLLLDALTFPFRKSWNFISKFIPGMEEMKSPSEYINENINESDSINTDNLSKDNLSKDSTSEKEKILADGLMQIIAKLDELNSNLINGKIAVFLDGVRVNSELARSTVKMGIKAQASSF